MKGEWLSTNSFSSLLALKAESDTLVDDDDDENDEGRGVGEEEDKEDEEPRTEEEDIFD